MNQKEIMRWLTESNPALLEKLWRMADQSRQAHVGDEVHLSGLIEISNMCIRNCAYCGINRNNKELNRYRLTFDQIMDSARRIDAAEFGTIILQAGEHPMISAQWIAEIVQYIKSETDLGVILCLGERSRDDYHMWREAGADRYLLKFVTSNRELYQQVHPATPNGWSSRYEILGYLKTIGYEIGSGFLIGFPGQTLGDLAADIETCRDLNLDMIAAGPFIPYVNTPLSQYDSIIRPVENQVVPYPSVSYKTVALLRLLSPKAHISTTTDPATIDAEARRDFGLQRGANVLIPNMTLAEYQCKHVVYSSERDQTGYDSDPRRLLKLIENVNRRPATTRNNTIHKNSHNGPQTSGPGMYSDSIDKKAG